MLMKGMKMQKKQMWLASSAVGAVLMSMPLSAVPAMAREVAAEEPQAGSEGVDPGVILVTARRRAEDVSTVPISISAISGEQIAKLGVSDLADVAKIAPGLAFTYSSSGKSNPFIAIRGQSRATTGNTSPGVLVYLNDVPLPNAGSIILTYDMADVQVLKGPQGTLFGRNAIGGAVLTNTKAPVHAFEGYVRGEIAQYNTHSIEAAINIPILKDRIALRLAGRIGREGTAAKGAVYDVFNIVSDGAGGVIGQPGRLNPNPSLMPGEFKDKSFRASLLIEPTDNIRNLTVYTYNQSRGMPAVVFSQLFPNGQANDGRNVAFYLRTPATGVTQALFQCPAQTIDCNIFTANAQLAGNAVPNGISYQVKDPGLANFTFKNITNTTTVTLGSDHQIKNIVGYTSVSNLSASSLGGTPQPIYISSQVYRIKQLTDELQASGSLFGRQLKYTVGGFLLKEDPYGPGGFGGLEGNSFGGLAHTISSNDLHNRSKALYAQFDYSPEWLVQGLTITAGLRQTWDKQATCTTSRSIPLTTPGPGLLINTKDDADRVFPSEDACKANSGLAAGAGTLPPGTTSLIFPYRDFKKLTYTLGANWQISRAAMVYVTNRRGYRTGGYNTPQFDPFLASAQTFGSETLTDWEIGTKLRWRGDNGMSATLNVAAYSGKVKGNQVPVSTSNLPSAGTCIPEAIGSAGRAADCATLATQTAYATGTPGVNIKHIATTVIGNSADLTIRGIDVDASVTPVQWLTLTGGLGYVDVKVGTLSLDPTIATLIKAAGRPQPTAASVIVQGQPKWTATAGAYLEYPGKVLGGKLSGSVNFTYRGAFNQTELLIPASKWADARVSLDDIGGTGLEMAVWVKNLTDAVIYPGGGLSSPSTLGGISYLFGGARTLGATTTFRW